MSTDDMNGKGPLPEAPLGRAPVPTGPVPIVDLDGELDEIEFLLQQGMHDDAASLLREIAVRMGPKVTTHERYRELRNRAKSSLEERPRGDGAPKATQAPKVEETRKTEEAPKAEETPRAEEAPTVEGPPNGAEEPKAVESSQAEETLKTEDEPKAADKPKGAETPKFEESRATSAASEVAAIPVSLPPLGSRLVAAGPVKLTPPPPVDTSNTVDPSSPLGERLARLKAKAKGPLAAAKVGDLAERTPVAAPKGKIGAPGSGSSIASTASPARGVPRDKASPAGKKDSPLLPPLGPIVSPDVNAVGSADIDLPVEEVATEEREEEPTREHSPSVPAVPGLALPALGTPSALPVAGRMPPAGSPPPTVAGPPPGVAPVAAATPFSDIHVELTAPIERQEEPSKNRIWLYGGIGGGVLVVLGILILAFSGSGKKGGGSKSGDKAASAGSAGKREDRPRASTLDATAGGAVARDAVPERAAARDREAPTRLTAPDPAAPSKVKLSITVEPAEADPTIIFRGQKHSGRKLEKEGLEASGKPELLRVWAPGFHSETVSITLDRTIQQTVTLKPRARERPAEGENRATQRRPPRVRPRAMLIDLD